MALEAKTFYLRHHLHVIVHSGKGLMAMDFLSKSDPLCRLHLKSAPWDVYKTKTCYNTLDPEWKEEVFDFFLFDEEDALVIEVFDYDNIPFERYEPLGNLILRTHHVIECGKKGEIHKKEFQLTPPPAYEKYKAGSLIISLYISPGWVGHEKLIMNPNYKPDYSQFKNLVLEGGGVKGIAYGGACKYLEEIGVLKNLENVAGTSAGALAALVLAVGASGKRMEQILLKETNFDTYMDKLFHSVVITFTFKHSLFEGQELEKDIRLKMHELLNENLKPLQEKGIDISFLGSLNDIEDRLTFEMLEKLHQLDPHTFKSLSCIGTNVTKQRAQVFNVKNTPKFLVWKAVRLSMGIPFFFPPIFADGCYFVDGGVAYNYPVDLYDFGDEPNMQTLGLKLDTPSEIAITLSNFKSTLPRDYDLANIILKGGDTKEPPFSLVPYISNILSYMMNQVNAGKLNKYDDSRTVYINSGSVGSTDFALSDDMKKGLCDYGRNAVRSFFTWWDLDQQSRLK